MSGSADPPGEEPSGDLAPQVYVETRDAERFERFHEHIRNHDPDWIYGLARALLTPVVAGPLRLRTIGRGRVPRRGPVILAPNHFSSWDHFMVGAPLPRPVQFMAKSQLYANPVLEYILMHGGAFPVRRGRNDEESMRTALSILDRGGIVLLYPEGGRSRSNTLGRPRPGVGRLALESGVPVIPTAVHGTRELRRWRRNLRRFELPAITVEYGAPMRFDRVSDPDRDAQQAAAERIFDRVRDLYEELERELTGRPRRAVLRARRRPTR